MYRHLRRMYRHLKGRTRDYGHDRQRAKRPRKHAALGLLQRQQHRDEEGLVPNLAEQDEEEGLRGGGGSSSSDSTSGWS